MYMLGAKDAPSLKMEDVRLDIQQQCIATGCGRTVAWLEDDHRSFLHRLLTSGPAYNSQLF